MLALALAVTLPWKFALPTVAPDKRGIALEGPASEFLRRHGFAATVEHRFAGVFIFGTSETCRTILLREAVGQAVNRDSIQLVGRKFGRVSFVFDGVIYQDIPNVGVSVNHYWTRLQQRLGWHTSRKPVIAVVASDDCKIDTLPWNEIAVLS